MKARKDMGGMAPVMASKPYTVTYQNQWTTVTLSQHGTENEALTAYRAQLWRPGIVRVLDVRTGAYLTG